MIDYFTPISHAKYASDSFQFFHVRVRSSVFSLFNQQFLSTSVSTKYVTFICFGASFHTEVQVKRNVYQYKNNAVNKERPIGHRVRN